MHFTDKVITLKDGRSATLRNPCKADAQALIDYMIDTAAETDFVLRYPEEIVMTVEKEEAFIAAVNDSPNDLMIVCEVEGRIAGNCHLAFGSKIKTRHRGDIAIALYRAFWGLGIGTAMFAEMIAMAKARAGVTVMELEFIEGNARARGLYEKMGFRIVGMHPDAIRQEDGELLALYLMQRPV